MSAINILTLSHSSICISNSIKANLTAQISKNYKGKHKNPSIKKSNLTVSTKLRALLFAPSINRKSKRAKKTESLTLKTSQKKRNKKK